MSLPSTMRSVRLQSWTSEPVLTEVAVPVPTGEQVLLRVDAAGLCQSDLHVMDAPPGQLPYQLPFTLGHEIAGTVVAAGESVAADVVGAQYLVHGIWGCGECRNCLRGRDNYCLRVAGGPVGGGLGRDGGLAEYVLVPSARHLVLNPGLLAAAAAPLTDAGLTALNAVSEHLALAAAGTTLLIGAGGLGHLALQMLLAVPDAYVIVVDTRSAARELALSLGAPAVAADVRGGVEQLEAARRGAGADLIVDFVGTEATLTAASEALAPGGVLVIVGSGGGSVEAAKGRRLPLGWRLVAPFWGPRADLVRVVELAVAGVLEAETTTFSLDDAVTAYQELRAGRVHGRAVVIP